jgi:hypothetical protein
MGTYVEVPAERLRKELTDHGFELLVPVGREEVYARRHHRDRSFVVKVYSSIARGAGTARSCGSDAIRVVVVRETTDGRIVGIWKGTRIHRSGSVDAVIKRMLDRMREGYGFVNERLKGGR